MKKCVLSSIGLLALAFFLVMVSYLPTAQAFDSTKVVLLPVIDRAGYKSPEVNAALMEKLRSQFNFPKYEVFLPPTALTGPVDRPALEKTSAENSADGVVALEITRMRSVVRTGMFDDEMFEQTDVSLILSYFDKKSGQYGRIKADRSVTQIASVYGGALSLSVEALEELLNKLDKIFPRQFPGPRY